MMILTIAQREFKTLFLSPLAWSILAVVQWLMAYLFLSQVEAFNVLQPRLVSMNDAPGIADIIITPLFGNAAIIFMLVTPLLTMRMICEERRNKTLALLLSSPTSHFQIILGKYLAVFGLLSVSILLTSLMPLSLLLGGTLDFGKLFANLLAMSLLVATYTAVGLLMSCITQQPTIAALSTFGLLLLLWVLDWSSSISDHPSPIMQYLSILRHFQNLQSGLISSEDVLYFVFVITLCLLLSILRLEQERLQKISPAVVHNSSVE